MNNKIWEIIKRSLETFSQNIFDEYIEANVAFRTRSGKKTVIIRRELGRCCDWCRSLAGIYDYDNAPREVYMRHDNCRCLVTFKNENGYTDAWSKVEYSSQRDARVARILDLGLDLRSNKELESLTRITKHELMNGYVPGRGKITRDPGFKDKDNKNEVYYANWLLKNIGGNITLRTRSQNRRKADYYWHEAFWEHKTFSSSNSLDKQVQSALGQASDGGGVVLQKKGSELTKIEMYKIIKNRFYRSAKDYNINQLYALVFDGDDIELALKLIKK